MKPSPIEPIGFSRQIRQTELREEEVYISGNGPSVILLPESPGAHEGVFDLGRELAQSGLTVHLMRLFGEVNRPFSKREAAKFVANACLSKEFTMLSRRRRSPMTDRVRAYGRMLYSKNRQPLGIVGMCITGNFALACLAEEWLLAPVLSQPSLPMPISGKRSKSFNASLHNIKKGLERKDLELMALRFTHDVMCPKSRFKTLENHFKDRFIGIEIDSSFGNTHKIPLSAHSVLTVHRVMKSGHPTAEALESVISFLHRNLRKQV